MGISEFGSSDVAADAPASLGGTAKFRAKIEGCFGGCGRLFGQNSLLRSITLVILIILTTVTSAGLKHYYLEGDTQILWTEIGGRLSAENGWGWGWGIGATGPIRIVDPECVVCVGGADSPASGGRDTEACAAAAKDDARDVAEGDAAGDAGDAGEGDIIFASGDGGRQETVLSSTSSVSATIGSYEPIVITPEVTGTDVLSRAILQEKLRMMTDIAKIQVCFAGADCKPLEVCKKVQVDCASTACTAATATVDCPFGGVCGSGGKCVPHVTSKMLVNNWQTLCSRIVPPPEFAAFAAVVPCNRPTVFDCFKEGSFDWNPLMADMLPTLLEGETGDILKGEYGVVGFDHFPSIHNATDEEIHKAVVGGCQGFANNVTLMEWHEARIIGNPTPGATVDGDPITLRADALQTVFLLADAGTVTGRSIYPIDDMVSNAILNAWRDKYMTFADDWKQGANRKYPNIRASILRSDALKTVLSETSTANLYLSAVGVAIMVTFIMLSLVNCPYTNGRECGCGTIPLGIAGIFLVICATFAAFGFTSWLKVAFNATSLQVLPFLALGLGVDDMFILIHTFEAVPRTLDPDASKGVASTMANTLGRAGPSICMTSLANFGAFLVGSTIPLIAVRDFCYMAAAIVFFNFVFVVAGMTVIFSWYESAKVRPKLERRASTTGDGEIRKAASLKDSEGGDDNESRSARCIQSYGAFITKTPIKVIVILIFGGFLGFTSYYATQIEDGLEVSEIAPEGSHMSRYLDDKFEYFAAQDAQIVTRDMDYPCRQKEFLELLEELRNETQWVNNVKVSWLELYLKYVNQPDQTAAPATVDGMCEPGSFYSGIAAWDRDAASALDILSAGKSLWWANGICCPEGYPCYGDVYDCTNTSLEIGGTTVEFTVHNLDSTAAYKEMISTVRGIFDKYQAKGVDAFPRGVPFEYWEQYVNLRANFWKAIGIALAVVFAVVLIFTADLLGALYTVAFIAMIVLEIFGMMGAMEIKFSAIPAVTLIMAVGMAVQFVSHLVLGFIVEPVGDKNARTIIALQRLLHPILQGGVSTFVSIVLLGFSTFKFIKLYIFAVFVMVCLVGILNGLVLLPVVLSLIGPSAAGMSGDKVLVKELQG